MQAARSRGERASRRRRRPGPGGGTRRAEDGHGQGHRGVGKRRARTGAAGRRERAERPRLTGAPRLRASAEAGKRKMVPVSLRQSIQRVQPFLGTEHAGHRALGVATALSLRVKSIRARTAPRSIGAAAGGPSVSALCGSPSVEDAASEGPCIRAWGERNSTNCGRLVTSPPGSQAGCGDE